MGTIFAILTLILGGAIGIGSLIYFFKSMNGYDDGFGCFIGIFGIVCLIIPTVYPFWQYSQYVEKFNQYKVIDRKIKQIDDNSNVLIEESKKVLLQYPDLEKSLLKDLKPETMIALGQTYPNLKSNETYNQIAGLIKERMLQKEQLQTQKIDLEKDLEIYKTWWWFASNWKEEASK